MISGGRAFAHHAPVMVLRRRAGWARPAAAPACREAPLLLEVSLLPADADADEDDDAGHESDHEDSGCGDEHGSYHGGSPCLPGLRCRGSTSSDRVVCPVWVIPDRRMLGTSRPVPM